jgi:hypothetical protein
VSRLWRALQRSFRGWFGAREQSPFQAICPLQSSYGVNASALRAGVSSGCSGLGWSGVAGKRASPLSRVCWMVHSYDFDLLFFVPFALGVAFMVWVFWNLAKQMKR